MSEGWKAGDKRAAGNTLENHNCRKRRRKLKYTVVDDKWGLGNGEDMKRMEEEEQAKSSFLKDGLTDWQKTGVAIHNKNLVRS